jgi:hypothetical protein
LAGQWSGGFVLGGAYSGQNLACGEIVHLGEIVVGGLNLIVYPGRKNQPYHNQTLGASSVNKSAVGWKGGSLCSNKKYREYSMLGRGG